MAADENGQGGAPPIRLMNFVSEDQLEEARKNRGARIEDGTAQRDRSLYEILKENKDKKDAEFNERFKHRPPKALDEDETEFLDALEMSKREYERQLADKEAEELRSFRAAVAAQSTIIHELKETPPVPPKVQDQKPVKKNPPPRPYMVVKVKPQAKRAKLDSGNAEERSTVVDTHKDVNPGPNSTNLPSVDTRESQESVKTQGVYTSESHIAAANSSLVSYSDDESDDDS